MQNRKSKTKQVRNSINTSKRSTTKKPVTGAGDVVEKITEKTGIKKAVKWLAGEDCGCDKRKEKLNKLFPLKKPLCFTEQEYQWMTKFRQNTNEKIEKEETKRLAEIYNRVFQTRRFYKPCTCNPAKWKELIGELNGIYETYEKETN